MVLPLTAWSVAALSVRRLILTEQETWLCKSRENA
jgi:hypothetical protein